MTAQADEPVAFLERAIMQAEQTVTNWHDRECEVHALSLTSLMTLQMAAEVPGAVCDCSGPTMILRRCASDRRLVELHGNRGHACPAYDHDGDLNDQARFYDHETCPVIQHLAEGYGWTKDFPRHTTAGQQKKPTEGDQVT